MIFKKQITNSKLNEEDAVMVLQQGSAEAFSLLYNSYAPKIYRFCLRMLGDEQKAADAFQETFMRVYESRTAFNGQNFGAWVFKIAHNNCLNLIRLEKKELLQFDEEIHLGKTDRNIEEVGLKEQLEKAIALLPMPLREALLLREYEDFSYQEIADTLNIELSLAKVRVHRARLFLRNLLKPIVQELNES
ncbi:sigma-70 family RNA polymerase sigma factor [Candidatus Kapaibacterium sp.]